MELYDDVLIQIRVEILVNCDLLNSFSLAKTKNFVLWKELDSKIIFSALSNLWTMPIERTFSLPIL